MFQPRAVFELRPLPGRRGQRLPQKGNGQLFAQSRIHFRQTDEHPPQVPQPREPVQVASRVQRAHGHEPHAAKNREPASQQVVQPIERLLFFGGERNRLGHIGGTQVLLEPLGVPVEVAPQLGDNALVVPPGRPHGHQQSRGGHQSKQPGKRQSPGARLGQPPPHKVRSGKHHSRPQRQVGRQGPDRCLFQGIPELPPLAKRERPSHPTHGKLPGPAVTQQSTVGLVAQGGRQGQHHHRSPKRPNRFPPQRAGLGDFRLR